MMSSSLNVALSFALAPEDGGEDLRFTYEACARLRDLASAFSHVTPSDANAAFSKVSPDASLSLDAFDAAVRRLAPSAAALPPASREVLTASLHSLWGFFASLESGGSSVRKVDLALGFALVCSGTKSDKLHFAWEILDKDRDGLLSHKQLWRLLRCMLASTMAFSDSATDMSPAARTARIQRLDDVALEATRAFIAPQNATGIGGDIDFETFGERYNSGANVSLPWLELLDVRKWPTDPVADNENDEGGRAEHTAENAEEDEGEYEYDETDDFDEADDADADGYGVDDIEEDDDDVDATYDDEYHDAELEEVTAYFAKEYARHGGPRASQVEDIDASTPARAGAASSFNARAPAAVTAAPPSPPVRRMTPPATRAARDTAATVARPPTPPRPSPSTVLIEIPLFPEGKVHLGESSTRWGVNGSILDELPTHLRFTARDISWAERVVTTSGLARLRPAQLLHAVIGVGDADGRTDGRLSQGGFTRAVASLMRMSLDAGAARPGESDVRELVTFLHGIFDAVAEEGPDGERKLEETDALLALLPLMYGDKSAKLTWAWRLLADDTSNEAAALTRGQLFRAFRRFLAALLALARGPHATYASSLASSLDDSIDSSASAARPVSAAEAASIALTAEAGAIEAVTLVFFETTRNNNSVVERSDKDQITLGELSTWYNAGGADALGWLELLDMRKWCWTRTVEPLGVAPPPVPRAPSSSWAATEQPRNRGIVVDEEDLSLEAQSADVSADMSFDRHAREAALDARRDANYRASVAAATAELAATDAAAQAANARSNALRAALDASVSASSAGSSSIMPPLPRAPTPRDAASDFSILAVDSVPPVFEIALSPAPVAETARLSLTGASRDLVLHVAAITGLANTPVRTIARTAARAAGSLPSLSLEKFNSLIRALVPASRLTPDDRTTLSSVFGAIFSSLDAASGGEGLVHWRDVAVALTIFCASAQKSDKIALAFELYAPAAAAEGEARLPRHALFAYLRALLSVLRAIQEKGAEIDLASAALAHASATGGEDPIGEGRGLPPGVRVTLRRRADCNADIATGANAFTSYIFDSVARLAGRRLEALQATAYRVPRASISFDDLASLYNDGQGFLTMQFFELLTIRKWSGAEESNGVPAPSEDVRSSLLFASNRALVQAALSHESLRSDQTGDYDEGALQDNFDEDLVNPGADSSMHEKEYDEGALQDDYDEQIAAAEEEASLDYNEGEEQDAEDEAWRTRPDPTPRASDEDAIGAADVDGEEDSYDAYNEGAEQDAEDEAWRTRPDPSPRANASGGGGSGVSGGDDDSMLSFEFSLPRINASSGNELNLRVSLDDSDALSGVLSATALFALDEADVLRALLDITRTEGGALVVRKDAFVNLVRSKLLVPEPPSPSTPRALAELSLCAFFWALDPRGSGVVPFAELALALILLVPRSSKSDKLTTAWMLFDGNADGNLNVRELHRLFNGLLTAVVVVTLWAKVRDIFNVVAPAEALSIAQRPLTATDRQAIEDAAVAIGDIAYANAIDSPNATSGISVLEFGEFYNYATRENGRFDAGEAFLWLELLDLGKWPSLPVDYDDEDGDDDADVDGEADDDDGYNEGAEQDAEDEAWRTRPDPSPKDGGVASAVAAGYSALPSAPPPARADKETNATSANTSLAGSSVLDFSADPSTVVFAFPVSESGDALMVTVEDVLVARVQAEASPLAKQSPAELEQILLPFAEDGAREGARVIRRSAFIGIVRVVVDSLADDMFAAIESPLTNTADTEEEVFEKAQTAVQAAREHGDILLRIFDVLHDNGESGVGEPVADLTDVLPALSLLAAGSKSVKLREAWRLRAGSVDGDASPGAPLGELSTDDFASFVASFLMGLFCMTRAGQSATAANLRDVVIAAAAEAAQVVFSLLGAAETDTISFDDFADLYNFAASGALRASESALLRQYGDALLPWVELLDSSKWVLPDIAAQAPARAGARAPTGDDVEGGLYSNESFGGASGVSETYGMHAVAAAEVEEDDDDADAYNEGAEQDAEDEAWRTRPDPTPKPEAAKPSPLNARAAPFNPASTAPSDADFASMQYGLRLTQSGVSLLFSRENVSAFSQFVRDTGFDALDTNTLMHAVLEAAGSSSSIDPRRVVAAVMSLLPGDVQHSSVIDRVVRAFTREGVCDALDVAGGLAVLSDSGARKSDKLLNVWRVFAEKLSTEGAPMSLPRSGVANFIHSLLLSITLWGRVSVPTGALPDGATLRDITGVSADEVVRLVWSNLSLRASDACSFDDFAAFYNEVGWGVAGFLELLDHRKWVPDVVAPQATARAPAPASAPPPPAPVMAVPQRAVVAPPPVPLPAASLAPPTSTARDAPADVAAVDSAVFRFPLPPLDVPLIVRSSDVTHMRMLRELAGLSNVPAAVFASQFSDALMESMLAARPVLAAGAPAVDTRMPVSLSAFQTAVSRVVPAGATLAPSAKATLSKALTTLFLMLDEYEALARDADSEQFGSSPRSTSGERDSDHWSGPGGWVIASASHESDDGVFDDGRGAPRVPASEVVTALLFFCSGKKTDKLQAAFSLADSDGDGAIGVTQLTSLLRGVLVGLAGVRSQAHLDAESRDETEALDSLNDAAAALAANVMRCANTRVLGKITFQELGDHCALASDRGRARQSSLSPYR